MAGTATPKKQGRIALWIGGAIVVVVLLGPVLGPASLAIKTTTDYSVPDVTLGSISLDCGSVLSPKNPPAITDSVSWNGGTITVLRSKLAATCSSARSDRKAIGIVLTVVGLLAWLALVWFIVRQRRGRPAAPARGTDAGSSAPDTRVSDPKEGR